MRRLATLGWKGLRLLTHWLLRVTALRQRSVFYSRFFGSDQAWVLLLKNLVNPTRFAGKIAYGYIDMLPQPYLRGSPAPVKSVSGEIKSLADGLRKEGILFFPAAHADVADHLLEVYSDFFRSVHPSPRYYNLALREIDQRILEFMVHDKYLEIMVDYYNGRQPYLRATGALKATDPTFATPPTRELLGNRSEFSSDWHYDTVNMLQIHFLLHDLTPQDTHMQVAKRQHRVHRVNLTPNDYNYSDEYVRSRFELVSVCGKKGTVVLWDSNAPHQAHLVVGRRRSFGQFLYSPGNNILTSEGSLGKDWTIVPDNLDFQRLSPLSRNALKYVIDDRPPEKRKISKEPRAGTRLAHGLRDELEVSNH